MMYCSNEGSELKYEDGFQHGTVNAVLAMHNVGLDPDAIVGALSSVGYEPEQIAENVRGQEDDVCRKILEIVTAEDVDDN